MCISRYLSKHLFTRLCMSVYLSISLVSYLSTCVAYSSQRKGSINSMRDTPFTILNRMQKKREREKKN